MFTFNKFSWLLYSYLNLESTKTLRQLDEDKKPLYSYLNLESTKTVLPFAFGHDKLYSYLNLESTKTIKDWNIYEI